MSAPGIAWDNTRPALPDDLFRAPDAEPRPPQEHVGPRAGDEPFRRPDPSALPDQDKTVVRPTPRITYVPPSPGGRPHAPGTPEADLLPAERPYSVPPPVGPARANFSGARGVMILLGLLVLAAIVGGVLWFTGGGTPTAPSTTTAAKSASAGTSARTSGSASATATAPKTPSGTPIDAFPPSGSALCGSSTTVAVNSTTSCEFALNVAAAIPASASGTFTVTATSPVTQKEYEMSCVKGTYTVCTGGVNAIVYVKTGA